MPVDEAAQRAIDAELCAWFATAHSGVPREDRRGRFRGSGVLRRRVRLGHG